MTMTWVLRQIDPPARVSDLTTMSPPPVNTTYKYLEVGKRSSGMVYNASNAFKSVSYKEAMTMARPQPSRLDYIPK